MRLSSYTVPYDPATRGGGGRRTDVGSRRHCIGSPPPKLSRPTCVYTNICSASPDPDEAEDFTTVLNADSLETLTTCRIEPSLAGASAGSRYQFERLGYFCVDTVDSTPERLVFNRTVTLRDTWAKMKGHRGSRNDGSFSWSRACSLADGCLRAEQSLTLRRAFQYNGAETGVQGSWGGAVLLLSPPGRNPYATSS